MATAPAGPAAGRVPSPPDLHAVPMVALNYGVRRRLGLYLNPRAAAAADWTALAEELGCEYLEIRRLEARPDPTAALLEDWQCRCPGGATVGRLLDLLRRLGRHDVLLDLADSVGEARRHPHPPLFPSLPSGRPAGRGGRLPLAPPALEAASPSRPCVREGEGAAGTGRPERSPSALRRRGPATARGGGRPPRS